MYVNVFAYFSREGFIIFCSFTVQLALRTFRCGLYQIPCHSQFVSQPRCSACSLYVEDSCPGGVGAEGLPYHANDGSFVLGAIPEDKTSGGRTVGHRNPKYVAPHKGHPFGGPGLNELSLQERAVRFVSIGELFEYHTSRLRVSRRWPMIGLWCRLHLTEPTAELMSVALWNCQTKRRTTVFKVVGWVMFSEPHYEETVGLKSSVYER